MRSRSKSAGRGRGTGRSKSPSAPSRPRSARKSRSPSESRSVGADSSTVVSQEQQVKSKAFDFEFGGPLGTFVLVLLIPCVIILLARLCIPNSDSCYEKLKSKSSLHGDSKASLPGNSSAIRESDAGYAESMQTCDRCFKGADVTKLVHIQNLAPSVDELLSPTAFFVVASWFAFLVLLERAVPCKIASGTLLHDKKTRLKYHINGLSSLGIVLILLIGTYLWDEPTALSALTFLHDKFEQLAVAAISLSILLSLYLYISSYRNEILAAIGGPNRFRSKVLLAPGGNSGWTVYDFWMGRELNPRIGDFDWKVFCELRPGMIGWALLNLGMAAKERQIKGHNSYNMLFVSAFQDYYVLGAFLNEEAIFDHLQLLTTHGIAGGQVNAFQGYYVLDALLNEEAILTTMDVTTDGFGFMLAFGDLAWVPFTYSLQARYLATRDAWPPELDWLVVPITLLGLGGLYMFRSANSQKDAFRRDPQSPGTRHLESMPTRRGTRLLVSGWWGLARKINYTGDWIFGLSWSLLTGFDSLVPYFYPIYFAILLMHRAMRDDHQCRIKYGADWGEYKRRVPSLFIPGVF